MSFFQSPNLNIAPYPQKVGIVSSYITGWWLTYPSEKYESQLSWDYYSNIYAKIKAMFQTTNKISIIIDSDIVILITIIITYIMFTPQIGIY